MSNIKILSENGNPQIKSYYDQIRQNISLQNLSLSNLENRSKELSKKQEIRINQLKEIEDKKNILLTRSRMLQVSLDRNAYKKKIIYGLLVIIFGIFISCLILYIIFIKKKIVQQ